MGVLNSKFAGECPRAPGLRLFLQAAFWEAHARSKSLECRSIKKLALVLDYEKCVWRKAMLIASNVQYQKLEAPTQALLLAKLPVVCMLTRTIGAESLYGLLNLEHAHVSS